MVPLEQAQPYGDGTVAGRDRAGQAAPGLVMPGAGQGRHQEQPGLEHQQVGASAVDLHGDHSPEDGHTGGMVP